MRHDAKCELNKGKTEWVAKQCECGSRAYKRDPLPPSELPIFIEDEDLIDLEAVR